MHSFSTNDSSVRCNCHAFNAWRIWNGLLSIEHPRLLREGMVLNTMLADVCQAVAGISPPFVNRVFNATSMIPHSATS